MARVGFLGMGEIAAALVQGLAGAGGAEGGHEIVVSPRNPTIAARLANEVAGVRIAADNEAVVAESDVVILCLWPRSRGRSCPVCRFGPPNR